MNKVVSLLKPLIPMLSAVYGLAIIYVTALPVAGGNQTFVNEMLTCLITLVGIAITLYFVLYVEPKLFHSSGQFPLKLPTISIITGLLLTAPLFLITEGYIVYGITSLAHPVQLEPLTYTADELHEDLLASIHAVLLAPVLEELCFRQMAISPFRRRSVQIIVSVVMAFLFGILHVRNFPGAFISALFMGDSIYLVTIYLVLCNITCREKPCDYTPCRLLLAATWRRADDKNPRYHLGRYEDTPRKFVFSHCRSILAEKETVNSNLATPMNIEEYRDYCLSLGDNIEGKMPFQKFKSEEGMLVFYVMGHMFSFFDCNDYSVISLKCQPERIGDLKEQHECIGNPYNESPKHWIGINPQTAPDNLLQELTRNSYEIVKAKYALPNHQLHTVATVCGYDLPRHPTKRRQNVSLDISKVV